MVDITTINEHCLTAEGAALLQYWRALRQKGPVQRADLSPFRLRPWLGNVGIVQREFNPAVHRVRLVGSRVAGHIGLNRTGKTVEEYCPPAAFDAVMKPYYTAYEADAPVLSRMAPAHPDSDFRWVDRLILPVASSDPEIDVLFYVWFGIDTYETATETTVYDQVYAVDDTPVAHQTALGKVPLSGAVRQEALDRSA